MADPAPSDLQQIADDLAARPAIPGAVVSWVNAEGQGVAVAGERVQGEGTAIEADDLWHIGSITKSMTATLAARLVDAGRVGWDDTIGQHLSPAHPEMDVAWADVTLETLLRHESGMRPNLSLFGRLSLWDGPRAEFVASMLQQGPASEQGGFVYSNAGYVVAGAMMEAATGQPWEDLIQEHVFAPLGITTAGFGPPQGAEPQGHSTRLFRGLRPAGQELAADNIPSMGPAGTVHLSAEDMLRYLRAHLTSDPAFLSPDAWAALHRPGAAPENYALGWIVEGSAYRHAGSNTFWLAMAWFDTDLERAAFVAVNSGDMNDVAEPVVNAAEAVLALGGE